MKMKIMRKLATYSFLVGMVFVLVWAAIGTSPQKGKEGGYYNAHENWQSPWH